MINSKTIQDPFSNPDMIVAIAYTGSYPVYVGYAAQGTAKSAAAWQIRKLTYDESYYVTDVQFADGVNDYTKVWDDRATYSYSCGNFEGGNMMNNDPWQHRSSGMKCGTCMWFVVKPLPVREGPQKDENPQADARGPLGRCRRHCPTMTGFPAVFVTDWCGDHKIDESRL